MKMMTIILNLIARLIIWFAPVLPSTTITIQGKLYLTRYYLLLRDWKWFNIYIHHFHMSDQFKELHTHPFRLALSFILFGGYYEEYIPLYANQICKRIVLPFTFNVVRHNVPHRVDLLDEKNGAWSLFVAGPRKTTRPEWGFVDRQTFEFTDWRENPEAVP